MVWGGGYIVVFFVWSFFLNKLRGKCKYIRNRLIVFKVKSRDDLEGVLDFVVFRL